MRGRTISDVFVIRRVYTARAIIIGEISAGRTRRIRATREWISK